MDNREAIRRRLEAAVYVAREAGMTAEEIREVADAAIADAERSRPKAGDALAAYRERYGHAA